MGEYEVIQYMDYNPAHAIWYIMETLAGLPAEWIDDASFLEAAETLYNENRGVSIWLNTQQSALSHIEYILLHINGILFYGNDKKYHLKLLRDNYDVNSLPSIDETMIMGPPKIEAGVFFDKPDEEFGELPSALDESWYSDLEMSKTRSQTLLTDVRIQFNELPHPGIPFDDGDDHDNEYFPLSARLTQLAAEITRPGKPLVRFTQVGVEITRGGSPYLRGTQLVAESLRLRPCEDGPGFVVHELTNPGAETGDLTGWTAEIGTPRIRSSNPDAHSGGYYFAGGASENITQWSQEIDLVAEGVPTLMIDAGEVYFSVSAYQGRYGAANDYGKIGFRTKDASKTEIATYWSALRHKASWTLVTADPGTYQPIEPGTRYVDVILHSDRHIGSNSDAYFDDVTAKSLWCINRSQTISAGVLRLEITPYPVAITGATAIGVEVNTVRLDYVILPVSLGEEAERVADYIKVSDVKAYNVDGGTFTSGAFRTRDINTEDSDTAGICSISGNQITLDAGTYECLIMCPAYKVALHVARLYDTTGTAVVINGTNAKAASSYNGLSHSVMVGRFTLSVQSTLEIQHQCQTTRNSDGFGEAHGFSGTDSVYTVAEFWRVSS